MQFDSDSFKNNLKARLKRQYSKDISQASVHEIYDAVAATVQELTMDNWMKSRSACEQKGIRSEYYFSAEFLMGRALSNNLINTLIKQNVIDTLQEIGIDYNIVENQEPDAALGNGGLGRLAACFLDSLATLNYSARGYGIRYKYGMF